MNRIKKKRLLLALLLFLLAAACSGCRLRTGDGLLTAPIPSGVPAGLQKALSGVLRGGNTFCAPEAGSDRTSVRFADLDGDGRDEAIALLQNTDDQTLTVCVFSEADGRYRELGRVSGAGYGFSRVEIAPLNAASGAQLVLTRTLTAETDKIIEVLSVREGVLAKTVSDTCTDFALVRTEDGQRLVTVRTGGLAKLFDMETDGVPTEKKVSLSADLTRLLNVCGGCLQKGLPAVFVTGSREDGTCVTEALSLQDGALRDLGTVGQADGLLFPTDLDGDGITELPERLTLSQEDGENDFSLVKWYSLDRKGKRTLRCTTLPCPSGEWYLIVPERWNDQITVRTLSADGGEGLEIAQLRDGEQALPIVSVYTFRGENRSVRGASEGRFVVAEKGGCTYSAQLGTSAWANLLTQETFREIFKLSGSDPAGS